MSKMSQLHAQLEMHAAEMGFANIAEAEAAGFSVNYRTGRLEKADEHTLAHEAWLAERDMVLKELRATRDAMEKSEMATCAAILDDAIRFIERGEV